MSKTVAAIFDNYSDAERAAYQIKEQGLRTDDISIVTSRVKKMTIQRACLWEQQGR